MDVVGARVFWELLLQKVVYTVRVYDDDGCGLWKIERLRVDVFVYPGNATAYEKSSSRLARYLPVSLF
jgi:hypothetical protein